MTFRMKFSQTFSNITHESSFKSSECETFKTIFGHGHCKTEILASHSATSTCDMVCIRLRSKLPLLTFVLSQHYNITDELSVEDNVRQYKVTRLCTLTWVGDMR